jgi:hypothetical protein
MAYKVFINIFMFKDYQFFSNNLQDAAKQILEAQNKENSRTVYTAGGRLSVPSNVNLTPEEEKYVSVGAAGSPEMQEDPRVLPRDQDYSTLGDMEEPAPSRVVGRNSAGNVGVYRSGDVDPSTGKVKSTLIGTERGSLTLPGTTEKMPYIDDAASKPANLGRMHVQAHDVQGPFREVDYKRQGDLLIGKELDLAAQKQAQRELSARQGTRYSEKRTQLGDFDQGGYPTNNQAGLPYSSGNITQAGAASDISPAAVRAVRSEIERSDAEQDWNPFTKTTPMDQIRQNVARRLMQSVAPKK